MRVGRLPVPLRKRGRSRCQNKCGNEGESELGQHCPGLAQTYSPIEIAMTAPPARAYVRRREQGAAIATGPYGDGLRGSPIAACVHLSPIRSRVGADDPAGGADHVRSEGAREHAVALVIGRHDHFVMTLLSGQSERTPCSRMLPRVIGRLGVDWSKEHLAEQTCGNHRYKNDGDGSGSK
jgi:hypothetical protein